MKTSKKIYITFFSLMALVLLSFFIPGKKRSFEWDNYTPEKLPLENFSHLKVKDSGFIRIQTDTQFQIEVQVKKDQTPKAPEYTISGDTLILSMYNNTIHDGNATRSLPLTLFAPGLQSVEINNSTVEYSISQDTLSVKMTDGELRFQNASDIHYLKADLNNCRLYNWNGSIKSADLNMDKSEVRFQGSIPEYLNIAAFNNSRYEGKRALKMNIDSDATSDVRLF